MHDYITLEQFFGHTDDNTKIILQDQDGNELGRYDGKNSIDPRYNNETIIYFKALEENTVLAEIYIA